MYNRNVFHAARFEVAANAKKKNPEGLRGFSMRYDISCCCGFLKKAANRRNIPITSVSAFAKKT